MNELANKLASATGLSVDDVSRCLKHLANLAYMESENGFVLPGFGKFRLVAGKETKGVNPFTGKPTVFRSPPEVEFSIDTAAKKAFLAGKPQESLSTSDAEAIEPLPCIELVPNVDGESAVDLDRDQLPMAKFKIGGTPDWLQGPETPVCCGDPMVFYGQLDSLGGEFVIGDMGIIYVFLCRQCSASKSIVQF